MTLEALSSNGLLNFLLSETLSPTPFKSLVDLEPLPENDVIISTKTIPEISLQEPPPPRQPPATNRGKKRRRRKPRVCKNEEEAENQRMTHIAVERNRRRQMNQHLSVLRSLMPQPFAHKGDQASIVGGAIDFIKELEHKLLSLEAQKLHNAKLNQSVTSSTSQDSNGEQESPHQPSSLSLSQFFLHSYDPSQENRNGSTSSVKTPMEDLEVTLIETHANIRILSRRRGFRWSTMATARPPQLSKLVSALQSLSLSILHLSVTTLDTYAIYSISAKVEESCQLSSVDDIAGAVHHMLSIIEEEPFCCSSMSELPFDFSLNHSNATHSL
ncbi:Myc-type basic helix-loop-helix (bHLH) domain [Arabidopsis thaliana x Arabidopsis arenosa]|uniref:Myc-type basic helix-loop-helix (BHLH) domain n=1 Tax=Arabidopsis thaliana x Arabidopsis arenosa TaxID=1240361 RepID=A0A8T1XKZ5_9BRAS|nr:Myc-type basic helix-loop-helix (bHLH) domain [Arabidopsis thaliana x Arabidopsis arenosa]